MPEPVAQGREPVQPDRDRLSELMVHIRSTSQLFHNFHDRSGSDVQQLESDLCALVPHLEKLGTPEAGVPAERVKTCGEVKGKLLKWCAYLAELEAKLPLRPEQEFSFLSEEEVSGGHREEVIRLFECYEEQCGKNLDWFNNRNKWLQA